MPETGSPLHPAVRQVIAALFTPEERKTITEMLIEECSPEKLSIPNGGGLERVHLAVLKLSQGDTDKFLAAAELARLDWRDVLVAAGFGNDLQAHLEWANEVIE